MRNLIIGSIIGAIVFIFAFQNTEIVSVELFIWTVSASRTIMLLLFFACGLLTGWIIANFNYRKKGNKTKTTTETEEQGN